MESARDLLAYIYILIRRFVRCRFWAGVRHFLQKIHEYKHCIAMGRRND